ncbi:tripartite tricarboxylate transporter TctB family protein [Methylorubrum suomiense]
MDAPLDGTSSRRGAVRAPQSLVAGLGLIGLGVFGVWASSDLDYGSLRAIGPGLMPFWLSIGVGICGLALAIAGFTHDGAPLQSFSVRGPVVITLAVLAFAITIRPFVLGGITTPASASSSPDRSPSSSRVMPAPRRASSNCSPWRCS